MSRWSIPDLAELTPTAIFQRCAYHMLSNGGDPREVVLKPDSLDFYHVRAKRWHTIVKRKRAPKHGQHIIADLERAYRELSPEQWPAEIARLAQLHKVDHHA